VDVGCLFVGGRNHRKKMAICLRNFLPLDGGKTTKNEEEKD
jgi:hypothetical protein